MTRPQRKKEAKRKNDTDPNPVKAIRFFRDDWPDIEAAAKLASLAPAAYVRVVALKAARSELRKAGKIPATG